MECICIIRMLFDGFEIWNIQLPVKLMSGFFLYESICADAVLSCYSVTCSKCFNEEFSFCFIPWSWLISIRTVNYCIINEVQLRYSFYIWIWTKGKKEFSPLLSLQWQVFGLLIKQSDSTLAAFSFWSTVAWSFHQIFLIYIYKYL